MNVSILKIAAVILLSTPIVAQHSRVSRDLDDQDLTSKVDVIIQYKQAPTAVDHQRIINGGGLLKRELHSINGAAYSISADQLAALESDPNVAYISKDRKLHGMLDNSAAAVNASTAWNSGLNGAGIGIALIDSGISQHNDLTTGGNRVVFNQSLVGGGNYDYYGHGEHVAGIIAGNGTESICSNCIRNFIGMAPKANLLSLRILDQNGAGTDSGVVAAIDLAIQLMSRFNIRVMNLSLGRPVFESYKLDPLCQAVEAAWKAGIVVVVAAGNDGRDNSEGNSGYGTITAPGNDPYVITVGAMKSMGTPVRTDDLIASYSSKGPTQVDHIIKPDLVAPGNLVVSLLSSTGSLPALFPQNKIPLDYYQSTKATTPSQYYFLLSGTSMAAPVVSGAAALLLQAHPTLTPDQVKARFMRTAYKKFPKSSTAYDPVTNQSFTSEYDIFTVGAGYLDIKAALADNTYFSGTALSPVATYSKAVALVACNASSVCSNPSIWAVQTIWGNQTIYGTQTIWGNQSIWGAQTIWGNQSVWSESTTDAVELTSIAINGEK